jgi:hypothetical protein
MLLSCPNFYANKKPRRIVGAKRGGTDWSACMKNRHRVSQVVSKLYLLTGGGRKILKRAAANCGQRGEPARGN